MRRRRRIYDVREVGKRFGVQRRGNSVIIGLYTAANGMRTIEERMDVISNNIANSSSPGFRAQRAVQQGFFGIFREKAGHPVYFNAAPGPGAGVKLVDTYTALRPGAFTTTDDPLHIALQGPGYLAVDTPQGERFTRNGHLTVNTLGQLSTADGHTVQGIGGDPITVAGGMAAITEEGNVLVDNLPVGQLRLVEFADPQALLREGYNLYAAPAPVLDMAAEAGETRVISGALESSNVQLPSEMVNMMLAVRMYSANQKVIATVDETASRLIEQVGAPI
jgi:flagellar basal-body rod protein FlgF